MPQMLYDSSSFFVVHEVGNPAEIEKMMLDQVPREHVEVMVQHIYEIVDKRAGLAICLHGGWAETFLNLTRDWMNNPPEEEVVEKVLEGYIQLAQIPMTVQ